MGNGAGEKRDEERWERARGKKGWRERARMRNRAGEKREDMWQRAKGEGVGEKEDRKGREEGCMGG